MHHRISREIHESHVGKPAAAPYPVAHDGINDQRKHKGENDEGHILDPFRNRSGYDGRRGSAEHKLEEKFSPEGNIRGQRAVVKGQIASAKNKQMARSHKGIIPSEHQPPAQKQKAQGRDGKDDEILGKDVNGVLRPCEARLHRCKAQIHKKYQNRGKQDPESIDYHCNIHILLPPVQIDHKGCGAFDPPSAEKFGYPSGIS